MMLYGSIDLTKIDKSLIKSVQMKDGTTHKFLSITINEKRQPQRFGDRVYTHSISCAPRREERKEGVNYFIGDLQTYAEVAPQPSAQPQPTGGFLSQPSAPAPAGDDTLPF